MRKEIIPSAPFRNYEELESLAMRADKQVKRIQIDICDGQYVPSTSWPFTEYSFEDFVKLGKKDDFDAYLPLWEDINYTVDLMCKNPENYIETFVAYGIDEIIIHYRSIEEDSGVFAKIVELASRYELKIYLAVDIKTDLAKFVKFADDNQESIFGFQVMGIEKIGFQGQAFAESSLEIVKNLKKHFKNKIVMFDGGINEETIEEVKDSGVDVFCVGSYLTKSENFDEDIKYLKSLI